MKDQMRDGHGSYTFPGGFFRYEGSWVKDKMHGAGVFALGDGTTYEGDFHDGEINGVGLKRWPDGSTYSGSFRDGEMHGEGVFLSAGGERYDGQWSDNQRSGAGELQLANRDVYRGEFRAHKPDGRGRMQYAESGRTYEGEWRAGVRSGEGVLSDRSGIILYEGMWSQDQRHGQGVGDIDVVATVEVDSATSTALTYQGVWEDDQPKDQTIRLAVLLLSRDGDELASLPATLTVEDKQLPPLAVVCYSSREAAPGQPTRVVGENGRPVVLKIFEGLSASSPDAPVEPNTTCDGEAPALSSQWQFVLDGPATEPEDGPRSIVATEDADKPEENAQASAEDEAPKPPTEHRVDRVESTCASGMAVFRDLRLPSATLPGIYYLVCESSTSDALEAVRVPLSVMADGATNSGGDQAQSAKK